jgi:hypothetical protein
MLSKYADARSLPYRLYSVLPESASVESIYFRMAKAIKIQLLFPFGLRSDCEGTWPNRVERKASFSAAWQAFQASSSSRAVGMRPAT